MALSRRVRWQRSGYGVEAADPDAVPLSWISPGVHGHGQGKCLRPLESAVTELGASGKLLTAAGGQPTIRS